MQTGGGNTGSGKTPTSPLKMKPGRPSKGKKLDEKAKLVSAGEYVVVFLSYFSCSTFLVIIVLSFCEFDLLLECYLIT